MKTMKTRMKTKKRKTTRIGSSLLLLLTLLCSILWSPAEAAKNKKEAGSYGLVGVTVFREPGFALGGAEVSLVANPEPGADPPKMKARKDTTDRRGEVVFRVPTAAMRYTVRAGAKGFAPQEKTASIEGEQRIDVTFMLVPESK